MDIDTEAIIEARKRVNLDMSAEEKRKILKQVYSDLKGKQDAKEIYGLMLTKQRREQDAKTKLDNIRFPDSYAEAVKVEKAADRAFRQLQSYRIGKLEEVRIAEYLTSIGYEVTDISLERNKLEWYSPFDLLAVSKYYSFLADVKFRTSRGSIPINIDKAYLYNNYAREDTIANERILIVCSLGIPDSFITIDDLQQCSIIHGNYIIPRENTKSITILRKIIEDGYRKDNEQT